MTDDQTGHLDVRLRHHSYRSGLWEAKEFAKQQWAEGYRWGLERARQIVSVNDGALWIWLIVQMCWGPLCRNPGLVARRREVVGSGGSLVG